MEGCQGRGGSICIAVRLVYVDAWTGLDLIVEGSEDKSLGGMNERMRPQLMFFC